MQYWEVLRVFDVATVVEDVSLVCLVPLDVVDFLPAGEAATLDANALDRSRVLDRYERLLRHSDVLARVVPWRLRRGLQALNDFAAYPRATVQAPTGAAMQVITVSVEVQLCTQDSLSEQLLLRGGARRASHLHREHRPARLGRTSGRGGLRAAPFTAAAVVHFCAHRGARRHGAPAADADLRRGPPQPGTG